MEPVDSHLLSALGALENVPSERTLASHEIEGLVRVFSAQVLSRHIDLQARLMRSAGEGYYTIGSAGHEANAFIADALRPTDPAFLHYRSGAFYQARAFQVEEIDGIRDVLLSLSAAADDPISGGRHKVFGRKELSIIPTTSTIASHLPRAIGVAFAIERAAKLGVPSAWEQDAVVTCTFGDASANHSTALGAINAACHTSYQGLNLPVLFVCEDNGLGISVGTPPGWIAASYSTRPAMKYFFARSTDPREMQRVSEDAVAYVRRTRKPAFLHVECVRFMAHAGSDAELGYRRTREIEADFARDPLIATARLLVETGEYDSARLVQYYENSRELVSQRALAIRHGRKLETAEEIMEPLLLGNAEAIRDEAGVSASAEDRQRTFRGRLPELEGPLTLSGAVNRTLMDAMARNRSIVLFGEDVGRKGGVYGVTTRLQKTFGMARVFDTLLDEQSILGLALGSSLSGMLPVPEIQYLAYLHNAIDQIRGEAATQKFFSGGRFRNGMVVRVAGLAYQKGFGGHFHNDNSLAALRDIPGIVVAVPSRGDDAASMLRTSLAAARVDGTVTLFVEPIALYHERDLLEPDDGGLLAAYSAPAEWTDQHIPIGSGRVHLSEDPEEDQLTIITFGNGVRMSLRVAHRLRREGWGVRVLDLRWLNPLPIEDILRHANSTGRVLVADETRASGGVSESVFTALIDGGYRGHLARVSSLDSFVPLADAADLVLLGEETVEDAARKLLTAD